METLDIIRLIFYGVVGIILPVIFVYKAVKGIRSLRNSQRKMEEFTALNKQILEYAEEIKDHNVKARYITFLSDMITDYRLHMDEYIKNSDKKIKEMKQDIFTKFGDHIPSLKQEFRDKRLNQILK